MATVNPVQKNKARCAEITDLIAAYLNNELDAVTKRAFEDHMARCSDCVAFLNTYKKTVQEVGSLEFENIPDAMLKRVETFMSKHIKNRRRS